MSPALSPILRGKTLVLALVVALLAAFAFVGGSAASASAAGTGSVSGTIYGQGDPSVPLANASVALELPGGSPVQNVSTSSDGTYSFVGLPAAGYILQVYPASGDNYSPQWWNGEPLTGTPDVLNLGDGQHFTANLTLAPISAATVSGTVLDASGDPLSSVSVSFLAIGGEYGGFGQTDANGNYTATGIAPGSYQVQFTAPIGSPYTGLWWNNETNQAASDPLVITAGADLTGIDATLPLGATISGTVTGSDTPGVGVAFATVVATTADGSSVELTDTNADGSYSIVGVASGPTTLEFFPPNSTNYVASWWQGESSLASADYFAVGTGATLSGYDTTLQLGGGISGTVTSAGSPVNGLFVSAFLPGNPNAVGYTVTQPDGTYTLTGLAQGNYDVEFPDQGETTDASQWWQNASTQATATPVAVTAGGTTTGIDAALGAGATISGTVSGKSASGALFAAQNASIAVYSADGSYVVQSGTDESGNYTLTNLAAGTYTLYFAGQPGTTDFIPQWWKNKSTEATATPITIRTGQTKANVNVVLANSTLKATTPKIDGVAKVGHTLTAKSGKWGPGTVAFSYQWARGGTAIAGAISSTYTPTNADAASTISVTVTGSETGYTTQSLTSASTAVVTGGTLSTAVPTITGTATHGQTLTAVSGTWGPGTVALTYKWFRGSNRIVGATNSSYTLVNADIGKAITVKVTGAETGFTAATVASAPTAIVH